MEFFLTFVSDAWILCSFLLLCVVAIGSFFVKKKDIEALNR